MSLGADSTHIELVSVDPADPSIRLGTVPVSSKTDVARAVDVARTAQARWAALGVKGRVESLTRLYEAIQANKADFAELETREMGRSLRTSAQSIDWALTQFAWNLAHAEEFLAPETNFEDATSLHQNFFEPYGVFGVIAPWNFPLSNWVMSCVQPLLAGNAVVYKASEEVALYPHLILSLWHATDQPKGVFDVVFGGGDVGDMLARAAIDFLDFTGSSQTGQHLYRIAAENFLPVRLELGGSDAGLVFDDVDLDAIIPTLFWAKFVNCGQICCGLKRLLVQETIYDALVARLIAYIQTKKVGAPMDPETVLGCLVSKRQQSLIAAQVDDAKKKGATVLLGGHLPDSASSLAKGAFYEPTLLTDVTPDMRAFSEELFGPALPIWKFRTEEEAVALANATDYGLSAYVFTADPARFDRLAAKLEAGVVSLNGADFSHPANPFGGMKKSGLGRVGGSLGLRHCCKIKTVSRVKKCPFL